METIKTEWVDTGEKRDACGRKLVRPEHRAALIAAYETSGLTQRQFAEREGISFWSFAKWMTRHRQQHQARPVFAEVRMAAVKADLRLEVALPSGIVVRGGEVEPLAALVQRLQSC
jgi:transposase-like protein